MYNIFKTTSFLDTSPFGSVRHNDTALLYNKLICLDKSKYISCYTNSHTLSF